MLLCFVLLSRSKLAFCDVIKVSSGMVKTIKKLTFFRCLAVSCLFSCCEKGQFCEYLFEKINNSILKNLVLHMNAFNVLNMKNYGGNLFLPTFNTIQILNTRVLVPEYEPLWRVHVLTRLFKTNHWLTAGIVFLEVSITSSIMLPNVSQDFWWVIFLTVLKKQNVLRSSASLLCLSLKNFI